MDSMQQSWRSGKVVFYPRKSQQREERSTAVAKYTCQRFMR